jgi:hypothetical protein
MMNSEVPMPKAETASASRGFRIGHFYCPRFLVENGRRRSHEAGNVAMRIGSYNLGGFRVASP